MESSWASRRKSIITAVIILILSSASFAVFWKFWYQTPDCFDGKKNGDEAGVDCGGSCSKVCSEGVVQPIVRWDPRLFEVLPGNWSVAVYVENPNTDLDATYLPYKFTIYNEANKVLTERAGATILPKNKTVGIFEGAISVSGEAKPKRAVFEIGNKVVWKKDGLPEGDMKITNKPLEKLETEPRVSASVSNNGTEEIKNIELVVVVFDGADNAIAASRTFVESVKRNESRDVVFTWPRPFKLSSRVCEKPLDVVLLLDRSGSMSSAGTSPAQPLTSAKEAAVSFVRELGVKDKAAIVSFATSAKNPIDLSLTPDFGIVTEAINRIEIETGSTQYTNIYEALHSGRQELASDRAQEESSKILVLLTDGQATSPKNPAGKTEEDDVKYAENLALKESETAKSEGFSIYSIGLGSEINEAFLKTFASEEGNYFFAPTAADLKGVYDKISRKICKEVPARIEITYKIFGSTI